MITQNFELFVRHAGDQEGTRVGQTTTLQQAERDFKSLIDNIRAGDVERVPESVTLLGPNGYVRRWLNEAQMTALDELVLDPTLPVHISVPDALTPEDPPAFWSVYQGETLGPSKPHGFGKPSLRFLEMIQDKAVHVESIDAWTRAQLHVGVREPKLPEASDDLEQFPAGLRAMERQVARLMATQSYYGYAFTDATRIRPRWKTLTPSLRIVSEKPSLSNWPRTHRVALAAEPGFRWCYLGWQFPELWLLAQQTKSPFLRVLCEQHPDVALAEVWKCELGKVLQTLYDVLRWGPTEPIADPVVDLRRDALVQLAPEWETWWTTACPTLEQGHDITHVSLPLFHAQVETDRKRAHGAYLRSTVALLLKVLLVRMWNWAELHAAEWDGLRTLIPLYDGVFYQVPAKLAAAKHAEAAQRLAFETWQQSLTPEPPIIDTLAGPSWGELYAVTDVLDSLDADFRDAHPNARYGE